MIDISKVESFVAVPGSEDNNALTVSTSEGGEDGAEDRKPASSTAMFFMCEDEDCEDAEVCEDRGDPDGGHRLSFMFEHNNLMNMGLRIHALASDLRSGNLLSMLEEEQFGKADSLSFGGAQSDVFGSTQRSMSRRKTNPMFARQKHQADDGKEASA